MNIFIMRTEILCDWGVIKNPEYYFPFYDYNTCRTTECFRMEVEA